MAILVSGANTWLTLNRVPLNFQDDDENLAAHAVENHKSILVITPNAPDNLRISVDNEEIETYRYGCWDWYPKDYAGLYHLQVSAPGYSLITAKVRVSPSKLSQERYEVMLANISEIATDLLFSIYSPASEKAIIQFRDQPASALRDYHLIQPIIYQLGNIFSQIRRSPYRKLQEQSEQRLLDEVHYFSGAIPSPSGSLIVLPKNVASRCGVNYLPESWTVQQSVLTYNVFENRLLKHFIQRQLITKISAIRDRAIAEKKRREQDRKIKLRNSWADDETTKIEELEQIIEECQKMLKWCTAWGGDAFLKSVKSLDMSGMATQVLLKNPFYNRFYNLYLQFQQVLKISLDTEHYVTALALRRMSDLYEFWSVFQITKIILNQLTDAGYRITSNNLFYELEQDNFQFDVRKNVASICLAQSDLRVELKYEPVYPKSIVVMKGLVSTDYNQLTPDMTIEVYKNDEIKHVIIFDAKYRYQQNDRFYYPKDEDLDKMRKYRDLIRYKEYNPRSPSQKPLRIVSSSYILYPGNYLEHDPDESEIGALPLVPKMTPKNRNEIEDAVEDILWVAELL